MKSQGTNVSPDTIIDYAQYLEDVKVDIGEREPQYFIGDNTAISRGHANIVDHNGEFFVVDTNSTNHTYVNGAMIQSGVETKLSHGDKIRLANEDFEFRMY